MNLGEHKGDGIRHSMHLSAPKGGLAQMLRDPDGQWVPYADYAALQAENERLRKAGDEMAEHFEGFSEWMENADGSPYVSSRLKAWLAAKGVQP